MYDEFLESRGHIVTERDWDEAKRKKQCPSCGGIHSPDAEQCESCGWEPVEQPR